MGNRLVDKTMVVTGSRADYCLCDSPSCSPRIKLFKEASLERYDESLPRDVALTLRLSPPDRDILPKIQMFTCLAYTSNPLSLVLHLFLSLSQSLTISLSQFSSCSFFIILSFLPLKLCFPQCPITSLSHTF